MLILSCLYEMLKAVSYESVLAGLDGMLRPGTFQCSSFQCYVQLSQESRDRVLIIMWCARPTIIVLSNTNVEQPSVYRLMLRWWVVLQNVRWLTASVICTLCLPTLPKCESNISVTSVLNTAFVEVSRGTNQTCNNHC